MALPAASTPDAASGVKMHSRSIASGSPGAGTSTKAAQMPSGTTSPIEPSAPHPVPRTGSLPSRGTSPNAAYGNTGSVTVAGLGVGAEWPAAATSGVLVAAAAPRTMAMAALLSTRRKMVVTVAP